MRNCFSLNQAAFAAFCTAIGIITLLNGHCSAQPFIAADYATNATYATGWSAGQNGGYGFTAWDFSGTSTNFPIEQEMAFDHSSPVDALGTAWTLFNPPGPGYGWISFAGRGFAPLQPFQTFEVVLDNPTNIYYGDGYTVVLESGTGNGYSGNSNTVQQVSAYTYGYYLYGWPTNSKWVVSDQYGNAYIGLNASDTAPAGVKIDFTALPSGNYQITMTPLNNPTNAQTYVSTLQNSGLPTDWMQFEFYNNETNAATNAFYISSMTIAGPALNIQLFGTNAVLTWLNMSNYLSPYNMELESSASVGPSAVWDAVTNPPAIISGQNVATNPIAGNRQFYRLYYP